MKITVSIVIAFVFGILVTSSIYPLLDREQEMQCKKEITAVEKKNATLENNLKALLKMYGGMESIVENLYYYAENPEETEPIFKQIVEERKKIQSIDEE